MRFGLAFLIVLGVIVAVLFARWVAKQVKAQRAGQWENRKFHADWETFISPGEDKIIVGIQRVARMGKRCEVVEKDSDVIEVDRSQIPVWEVGVEVDVAEREMSGYADLLNKSRQYI